MLMKEIAVSETWADPVVGIELASERPLELARTNNGLLWVVSSVLVNYDERVDELIASLSPVRHHGYIHWPHMQLLDEGVHVVEIQSAALVVPLAFRDIPDFYSANRLVCVNHFELLAWARVHLSDNEDVSAIAFGSSCDIAGTRNYVVYRQNSIRREVDLCPEDPVPSGMTVLGKRPV